MTKQALSTVRCYPSGAPYRTEASFEILLMMFSGVPIPSIAMNVLYEAKAPLFLSDGTFEAIVFDKTDFSDLRASLAAPLSLRPLVISF